MNGYELTRMWYDFKFENPDLVKHIHSDLFFYIVDRWNRLGQKEKIGLPTSFTMEAVGINSYNTYKKVLNDLIEFGFIKSVLDSKNQHQSRVIALSFFDKAKYKALDEAINKAIDKSLDTIIEEKNKRKEEEKNNLEICVYSNPFELPVISKDSKQPFNFKKEMVDYGFNEEIVKEWLLVRKNKKATNSQIAFNKFISEIEKMNGVNINSVLTEIVSNSWSGFKSEWLSNNKKVQNEQVNQNLLEIIAANPGVY